MRRVIGNLRAARWLGMAAFTRRWSCGPRMSLQRGGPCSLELGHRVRFGPDCGIALVPMGPSSRATLSIGDRTSFQSRLSLNCAERVEIGADCVVSWDVHIMDTDFHELVERDGMPRDRIAPVRIGDRVWIGARVTILKGVTIGPDSVIGAGSVVTRSYPAHSLIAGNPARHLREISGWNV